MTALRAQGLRAVVGSFRLEVPELSVERGELVCVMGPSGSGKSTLLHALAGFLPVEAGRVWVADQEVTALPPEKRRIALVFQEAALFPHLTVSGNVAFGLQVQRVPEPERLAKVESWLRRLGIADLADRLPHEISGGQAQRVALARALVVGFPAVLLDEPLSAVDEQMRQALARDVRGILRAEGTGAILVTHDTREARDLADRVCHLKDGHLT